MNTRERALGSPPATFLDAGTRQPAFGSYRGRLPRIRLPRGTVRERLLLRKRWLYLAVASDRIWASIGVVRTGYASTAFAFVYDLEARSMLVDWTRLGPAPLARVADASHENGTLARFDLPGSRVAVTRSGPELEVRVQGDGLDVDAVLDERRAPSSIGAIAPLGGNLFSATEKRALTAVRGSVRAAERTFDLAGAAGGWDYTYGLLPRRTRWRWAFALGRSRAGEPLAFNLVEGFVGEAECAAFFGGEVRPLGEPRFTLDRSAPERPWKLEGEGIDLRFRPGAIHAQRTNLLVVRSRFVQPVGTFEGSIRIGGRDVAVEGLPGVVEDQDVLW